MEINKYLLIVGDSGILTQALIKVFKNNSSNWKILLIDQVANTDADKTITLEASDTYSENLLKKLYPEIENFQIKYDAIIHVEGGLIRGSIISSNIFEQTSKMLEK